MKEKLMIFDFNSNTAREVSPNENTDNLPKNQELATYTYASNGDLLDARFNDESIDRFNALLMGREFKDRKKQEGAKLSDQIGDRMVTIIRASTDKTNTFSPMDYVIVHNGLVSPSIYKQVQEHLTGDRDLVTPQQRVVGWVAEHAQTMAVSYSDPHHVMIGRVKASSISHATNNGEYFYTGGNVQGKVVISLNEIGMPISPEKDNKKEVDSGLSM